MTAAAALPTPATSPLESAREQMLAAFVTELNRARLRYCLLSGFREEDRAESSDVDFMVVPEQAPLIAPLLTNVARYTKARLVQAIPHETGACYFALAKQVGDEVAYLHPDCTTDYRRDGRMWLEADEMLARRRKVGASYVPSSPDEFIYYLTKKVLKQHIEPCDVRRLRILYAVAPEESSDNLRRFWCSTTVASITSAVLRGDIAWWQRSMGSLLGELLASDRVEGPLRRSLHHAHELRRRISRMMRPTGASIVVYGGDPAWRSELATTLLENLRPAFRHAFACDDDMEFSQGREWYARIHSTVVLHATSAHKTSFFSPTDDEFGVNADQHDAASATHQALSWLERRAIRRLAGA
jgi:hypothetical protein